MTVHMFFSWIGQLVAVGGGGAIVASAVFRYLGKGWIENQLAKNLEAAKSEISLLAARKMKLHDREYVVFPEVWSKLNKAFSSLGIAVFSFREMPDLGRMDPGEIESWADRSNFSEDEKRFLLREQDKNKAYGRILDWRDLAEANKDFIDFYTCLQENRIFLSPDVKLKLDEIASLLKASWVAKKMDWDGHTLEGKSFLTEAYEKYDKEAKPIMAQIEGLVQERLFPNNQDLVPRG